MVKIPCIFDVLDTLLFETSGNCTTINLKGMKVSIITVVYNNKKNIESCINSVLSQTYDDLEYIIVDGGSTDGTTDVVSSYVNRIDKFISEPDDGIYDAMNKGIQLASGDMIGILNSDDLYHSPNVINEIATKAKDLNVESVYGDLVYVNDSNSAVIRYWKSGEYRDGLMKKGWMPPHPAFFVKKDVYEQYGYYDTSYNISADYEMMLRLLHKHGISTAYHPEIITRMRWGGRSSSIYNYLEKYKEDLNAMRTNGIDFPVPTLIWKNVSKVSQFWKR